MEPETMAVNAADLLKEGANLGFCEAFLADSPMPTAVLEHDDHIVRYLNPAFCKLLGKSLPALLGQPFCEVTPLGTDCDPLFDLVYETGHPQTYAALGNAAPLPLYHSCSIWPIRHKNGHIQAVVFQITETTEAHLRLIAANEALVVSSVRQHELTERAERLSERLQRANQDLRHFAFAASHDLQEPLRVVSTYSQLLVRSYRSDLDGEASVFVDYITRGARHMRELLIDLLKFAEAGVENGEPAQRFDLNVVLDEVKSSLRVALDESAAILTSDALPAVDGVGVHFEQLFQNLVSNAIKYRGEAPLRIHISVEQQASDWHFAVSDNGIGIAPEYFQMIFSPFKRIQGRSMSGTGMGLTICKRVVERYGGRIWVESTPGQGSTFHFTLPAVLPRY
ncbi:MAG: integral rane sensor signal transduction histidine kinase [Bryobacterales bacterium]|nr:integral rane sensor signal transduction histidine kinase [Bryobacterales bacterium]